MQALTVFPANRFRWLVIKFLLIEKHCSEETLVDGIVKKSLAIFESLGY